MSFNPIEHPMSFIQPRMMSDISEWIEHIPFAFALVDMCRPRVIVELGTHKGDSYCAFCQAIEILKLPTRAYAIDTWKGDAHAGAYGPDVLAQLRAHHDPLYTQFSTLIPKTFDDALADIADGSVDLLHIDGLHTYDAVRHDFDTWKPKLSDRGVVIFHDTFERVADFAVYKLMGELKAQYPLFEFEHGHGLGVVGVGRNLPERFAQFMSVAASHPIDVKGFFSYRGRQVTILRMLWSVMNAGVQLRSIVNEWQRVAGKNIPAAPSTVAAAFGDPTRFFASVVNDVYAMAADDLALRQKPIGS